MAWFKVVRPDMGSFADPKFKYRIGGERNAPKVDSREICAPGLLHASPSAPEAARYGKWPYRLLAVDPESEPYARQDDKAGFLRLRVVEELPVSECFGPNGEAVLAIIRRAEQTTADEARRLDAAWVAAWYATWDAARVAAWYAARDAARVAARDAAWDATWDAAWVAAWDATWDATWVAARYAAVATCVADLIGQHGYTQEHHDLLMAPWREVIG